MKRYLSVSEMARIHNISRQTLIYYDKINLFKPERVDENGYRYYSFNQIPFLREICYLKSAGIKLDEIKDYIKNKNLTTAISLLQFHKDYINAEIQNLSITLESIENKLIAYEKVNINDNNEELYLPTIENFSERKAVFFPYENEICKEELHITMMKAWNTLEQHGILPSNDFGTIILKNSIGKNNILEGSGVYMIVNINDVDDIEADYIITLPAGKYVSMYKYGMPYETEFLFKLLEWIRSNNYIVTGNIIDACILDTTFYKNSTDVDFCQLQIPVEKF
ncbi:MAG: MerR family transcriptional regulator [Sedimentibacter sp.]